ncbi:MAG TPA: alternative ribosome rescue aminoacyl-tRNA hydrolase ArfB [Gemmatimonadales bacterium]|nr:alternative ribosome rescue aminoacyl-tRNA hydrolase ArfB [Gemmatimonadales bacterium]
MTPPASNGGEHEERGLKVNGRVTIPRHELEVRATRAGGPGGQHVNTSSTRVEIVWNPLTSSALNDDERARISERLASRLTADGTLRVVGREFRSQRRNRDAAEERLAELVRAALVIPKARRATRPGRAAREARLADKKHVSDRKKSRRWRPDD